MSNTAITQSGIFGVGPGVGQGMWTLVERKDIATATQSAVFSNLDGDSAIRYKLVFYVINTYAGSKELLLQFNTDTSAATNYQTLRHYVASGSTGYASVTSMAGIMLAYTDENGYVVCGETEIFAKTTGKYRFAQTNITRSDSSAPATVMELFNGGWKNVADKVDTITLKHTGGANIGAGSYVELWKLAQ